MVGSVCNASKLEFDPRGAGGVGNVALIYLLSPWLIAQQHAVQWSAFRQSLQSCPSNLTRMYAMRLTGCRINWTPFRRIVAGRGGLLQVPNPMHASIEHGVVFSVALIDLLC